jgi:ATP-dependent exoDNAse (exonuclease V) alpha subunit
MTTHKAQGSTYNKIFVNWPDMRTNRKVLERNQLLYVACSRPTQELHILY